MQNNIKQKFVLPIICAISAILLASVNMITAPKIASYEKSETERALNEVSCGYTFNERIDVLDNTYVDYYYQLNDKSTICGYILGLKTNGYGGEITLVASFDLNGKILAVKLLTNNETPGVGKKAENANYMNMFIDKGSSSPIPTNKNMLNDGDLTLVSGATLTFSGISKALYEGSLFIQSMR